jgi:hypothetical protein
MKRRDECRRAILSGGAGVGVFLCAFAVLSPNFIAICEDFLAAKERKEHKKGISSLRSLCSFAAYGFGCGFAALWLCVEIRAYPRLKGFHDKTRGN